jgi:hypothetical protein
MWIVSQDGNICNTDTMRTIERNGNYIHMCHEGATSFLGLYSSEEKAKAVIGELVKTQISGIIFQNVDVTEDLKDILKDYRPVIRANIKDKQSEISIMPGIGIYYMPQDESVEI